MYSPKKYNIVHYNHPQKWYSRKFFNITWNFLFRLKTHSGSALVQWSKFLAMFPEVVIGRKSLESNNEFQKRNHLEPCQNIVWRSCLLFCFSIGENIWPSDFLIVQTMVQDDSFAQPLVIQNYQDLQVPRKTIKFVKYTWNRQNVK